MIPLPQSVTDYGNSVILRNAMAEIKSLLGEWKIDDKEYFLKQKRADKLLIVSNYPHEIAKSQNPQ
jgi:hypothetical protein